MLNPGYRPERDERDLRHLDLRLVQRSQLTGVAPFPWHLTEWSWTGAGEYFGPLLTELAQDVGHAAVATGFACLQLVGYHSRRWASPSGDLGTQQFAARVLRFALARGALVVAARGWPGWCRLVPELSGGASVPRLTAPRSAPHLTRSRLGAELYGRFVKALQA